jgi:FkbM family methyltransferase
MQHAISKPANEPCRLIKEHFPGFAPDVIFDVGANVGKSAQAFAQAFPGAAIYAFEPVSSVYAALAENLAHEPRVRTFNAALGRGPGRAFATRRSTSVSNRIVDAPTMFERHKTESVAMTSGDAFSAEHGIDRIGFLKIDAEGHDLEVLVGFQKMLAAARIDILEAEVGMNRDNRRHVPFEAVKAYLEPLSYHLFHLHDLAMDTPLSGRAVLRRANAMFVSDSFVEARRAESRKASVRAEELR